MTTLVTRERPVARRCVRIVSSSVAVGALVAGTVAATTTSADAADNRTWNRLAQCESGGNWAINTGNGYQGGLQFSPSTWNAYGGQEYAATANQASREQQIVVAERVLEGQGWGAWPSCSSSLGLSSAPTQRSAPSTTAPEASTPAPTAERVVPQLPENSPLTAEAQSLVSGFEQGVEALQNAGVDIDPSILDAVRAVLPQ